MIVLFMPVFCVSNIVLLPAMSKELCIRWWRSMRQCCCLTATHSCLKLWTFRWRVLLQVRTFAVNGLFRSRDSDDKNTPEISVSFLWQFNQARTLFPHIWFKRELWYLFIISMALFLLKSCLIMLFKKYVRDNYYEGVTCIVLWHSVAKWAKIITIWFW